jgi:arginase
MLTLRREGRLGIAYLDGHDDFRHLGIADHVGASAGDDLAIMTGRGADDLADIDGVRPYVRGADALVSLSRGLLALPGAAGFELTVFDPDLDQDGRQAALVADVLERTFSR